MLKTCDLYDLRHSLAGEYLSGFEYPWQALKDLREKGLYPEFLWEE